MKKLIALLAAATLAGGAFAQSFPDVPSGHWAEDAVEQIAELNIVIGFPDGTFRGNEAFTRYQASLVMSRMLGVIDADMATMDARLSAAESTIAGLSDDVDAAMMSGMGGDALQDVQNQVSAARVATDANANEIAALEESVSDDMASIREFAILLRRNQVALGDRVTALEEQTAGIGALESRVADLETNPLGLSGSIALEYYVGRNSDRDDTLPPFDIDRAYGVGMDRDMGESYFSTGTDADANEVGDDDVVDEPGEYAEDQGDIEYGSDFTTDLTLEASYAIGGASVDRGLNSFDAVVTIALDESAMPIFDQDDDIEGADTNAWAFYLEDLKVTYDGIGAAPMTFNYGEAVTASFTPYTLERENVGFTAALGAPDALAFLDPSLDVAYITTDDGDETLETANETMGVRGQLSAIEGLTGGFSFVRHQTDTTDGNQPDDTDDSTTIFGLDGAGDLDLGALGLSVSGEYANASSSVEGVDAIDVLYVDASTTIDVLGGVTLGGSYRDIDPGWTDFLTFDGADEPYTLVDADAFPYAENQQGFEVEGSATVAMVTVGGFFERYDYDLTDDADNLVQVWGAEASADLFAGFSPSVKYTTVNENDSTVPGASVDPNEDEYGTGISTGIAHDGAASNALIANLNLAANYSLDYEAATDEFSMTTIDASGDYTLSVAGATVTPYASFETVDGDGNENDSQTITAGTGFVTEPLDAFLAPSLEAAVNYMQSTQKAGGSNEFDADQLQWSVGLNLDEFLFPNSSMAARYGSYAGTNVYLDGTTIEPGTGVVDDVIDDPTDNDDRTASVMGFEVEWNYYDLMFGFGQYTNDPDTDVDEDDVTAQVFSVAYEVAF